jgi:uncharacterized Rmd1/YagE family protein
MTRPFDDPEHEEVELRIDPDAREGAAAGEIRLREADVDRLRLVADILARSVVLAHYEETVADAFDRVEPVARAIQAGRTARRRSRELLKQIGEALLVETTTVGRVEVEEKPELLWERPDLEVLWSRLEDEYELSERHRAIERKLAVVSRTAQTLLELLQHRHSLRVEWAIVILILVEIVIMAGEMLGG